MKENPIDIDKVADHPHLLEYAHTVGSSIIKPLDKGKIKGQALSSMYEQTNMQLDQIKEQIDLLARQAKEIQDRIIVSEKIYQAECGFKPIAGKIYHLYEKENGSNMLSLIGPSEWRSKISMQFIATVHLLSDHTWKIID